jgi:hypothetical protein
MRQFCAILATLGSITLALIAFPTVGPAQTSTPNQSVVFLCNEIADPIIAQYDLLDGWCPTADDASIAAAYGTL